MLDSVFQSPNEQNEFKSIILRANPWRNRYREVT